MRARLYHPLLLALLVRATQLLAADDAWLIVPGKSVGKVTIGMEQAEVFRLLGTPHGQNDFEGTDRGFTYIQPRKGGETNADGITQSDWITPLPLPKSSSDVTDHPCMCDFVTVYIRDATVVQIEVRVPRFHTADGLACTSKEGEWRKRFPQAEEFFGKYHHPSAGGIPATKHFVTFADDVQGGIAWTQDGFGNLAPEVDFQPDGSLFTVVVHAPGKRLVPDPDGGSRFIWKDYPARRQGD